MSTNQLYIKKLTTSIVSLLVVIHIFELPTGNMCYVYIILNKKATDKSGNKIKRGFC